MAMAAVDQGFSTENCGGGSPRISFSHDLYLCDVVPVEQRPPRSRSKNPSIEFDFCAHDHSSSATADQLFSDGKLLPKEFKNNRNTPNKNINAALSAPLGHVGEYPKIARDETGEEEMMMGSKSFWRFGRSSSLNCGSGYGRALCPLPPLSRSNSTGSSTSAPKEKQKHCRGPKPPLNKNGVRVTPVLNVPSGNLFGLTSLFFNGRDKNRRKS